MNDPQSNPETNGKQNEQDAKQNKDRSCDTHDWRECTGPYCGA